MPHQKQPTGAGFSSLLTLRVCSIMAEKDCQQGSEATGPTVLAMENREKNSGVGFPSPFNSCQDPSTRHGATHLQGELSLLI